MTRLLSEAPLGTRSARASLGEGIHWRGIDPDIHLGYRKRRRGGRWLVRWYAGNQRYLQETIGTADDVVTEGTLSFSDAVNVARSTVVAARRAAEDRADGPTHTVKSAVESYILARNARLSAQVGRPRRSDAASRMELHVLRDKTFAEIELRALTEDALADWRRKVERKPKLKATSRQRTATDLKAALNAAYRSYRRKLPSDFAETVKHGLAPADEGVPPPRIERENQILSDETIREIIRIASRLDAEGDLGRMIIVLAATGARFSQVQRLQVRDVQVDRSRVIMPRSRKGKGRADASYAVPVGEDVLRALEPALGRRKPSEPLLCRWRHVQIGIGVWRRDRRGAWTSASEMSRPWQAICSELGLDRVVPYSLRHSSIVRGIRTGLPIRLVGALHDTSVVMIERHYARFIVDGLEELAAKAVIPLVSGSEPSPPTIGRSIRRGPGYEGRAGRNRSP